MKRAFRQNLPEEAVSHFLDNLLLDEIINTNRIERVEIDATELSAIIKSIGNQPEEQGTRLGSMARTNGQLFRDELPYGAIVIGSATKIVHVPPVSSVGLSV